MQENMKKEEKKMNREIYSEKELRLYDYIDTRKVDITAALIKSELGEEYIGALGKLIRDELIEGKKKNIPDKSNRYGTKWTKYYTVIKKEKE